MKKFYFALMMLTATISANAMSYEQARNEALFLTDKMAYELNLTDAQYEAAYEINLDYLMGVTGRDDVFGVYWERRNLDLSYILFDWQWNAFLAASYFYRPLYWDAGYWHFGIYARYPHRDYFFFGRPHFYATYRGGHAWHVYGGHGYYHGHSNHYRAPHHEHFGMHDRWNRGDFRNPRNSSTRITGRPGGGNFDNRRGSGNFDNRRGGSPRMENRGDNRRIENNGGNRRIESSGGNRNYDNHRYDGSHSSSGNFSGMRGGSHSSSGSFGGSRSGGSHSSSGSFGGSRGGSSHSSGGFSSSRSSSSSHSGGGSHGHSSGGSRMGGHR